MVSEKKKFKTNEVGKSWLLLGIAFSFMLTVFAPLDAYFSNQSEFWFDLKQLIPILLTVFIILLLIMLGVFWIINKTKAALLIYGFFTCTFLYFYIQGNYIPRNYGVLNGVDINWGEYPLYAIASIILFIVCISLWLILIFKLRDKIFKIGKISSVFIILIQIATIGTLFIQNNVINKQERNNVVVTDKEIYNLSKNNNIIVFILDSFDSNVMKEMLASQNGEKYKSIFEDFTYYPDTLGAYPTTKGSLPFILTGIWYENDKTYSQYIKDAYINNKIYNAFTENNYSLGVYTSNLFVNPDSDMYVNIEEGSYVIKNYTSFVGKLYNLVAFNYMPHQLKKLFYTDTEMFETLKTYTSGSYSLEDKEFYDNLLDSGLSVGDDTNCFKLYHLAGVHPPYTYDENFISDKNKAYDRYDEAAGCFTMLQMYMDQLKKKGIYDDTTIIVMADHGYTNLCQNPLFMIKNVNENHEFKVSEAAMSWEYLSDIFISLASQKTVDDIYISNLNTKNPQRRYLLYSWDDTWARQYLPKMNEYILIDNASEPSNLEITGRFYIPEDEEIGYKYELGSVLSFMEEDTASQYCVNGFSENEGTHTWISGKSATMMFTLDEDFNDLEVSIDCATINGIQNVTIYANENFIGDYEFNGDKINSIIIPNEYINGGTLILRFELPDAISPKELGASEDSRQLSLAMKTMSISGRTGD